MTGRLRVAVVARSVFPFHGVGGLERSVYDLVRYLASHHVAVTLITRTSKRQATAEEIDADIAVRFVPYRTFPLAGRRGTTVLDRSTAYPIFGMRAGRAAAEMVEAGCIDLVHGFGASVLGYARRRRTAGAPLVLNPQGLEEFGATDPSRAKLKRAAYLPLRRAVLACARAADRIIATDRSLESAVRQHLHVPDERIRTIPNALDVAAIDRLASASDGARVRRTAGIGDREIVLLSAGRIEANKGFHVLAAALAAVREHAPHLEENGWRWVVAGEGPYRRRLEQAVADAGLRARVIFAGRVNDADLHAWYEAATLFVHPTLYEGSSLVTLEAMAHHRAVVATTAGGLPDKVKPGETGWLVAPGDPSALAAAISGALGDLPRLKRMGEAGRALLEREFSWTTAGAATLRLYQDLIRSRHSGRLAAIERE